MRTEPQEAGGQETVSPVRMERDRRGLQGHSPEVVGDLEPVMEKSEQCQGGREERDGGTRAHNPPMHFCSEKKRNGMRAGEGTGIEWRFSVEDARENCLFV